MGTNNVNSHGFLFLTLVFSLNATGSEIPEMFLITHRQNHAVKTQTKRGSQSQSHAQRAQGLGPLTTVPSLPPFPTNSCLIPHPPMLPSPIEQF